MNINQELLNKYAAGQCSDEEALQVEQWLEDDSWESIEETDKYVDDRIATDIWKEVSVKVQPPFQRRIKRLSMVASIAVLFGIGVFYFQPASLDAHSFSNNSLEQSKSFSKINYDLILSSNSNAEIDLVNNKLVVTGDIMLSPKRDFTLQDSDKRVLDFKAGEKYIVLNSSELGKTIILQQVDVAFLPPLMQDRIRTQFLSVL